MTVRQDPEPPADFPLPADVLAFIVLKARAYDAEVDPDDPNSGSNAADDRAVDVLEDTRDNFNGAELRDAIISLNEDEKRALVALAWIGRGDFGADEWKAAVQLARERASGHTARYLMEMPLLGDYLEGGADALGVSLTSEEQIGMHNPATEEPSENDRD